jgi:hypothetical protein
MEKRIKGVFIDVVNKEIKEVEIENKLDAIYQLLGCELIESCYSITFNPANHVMFCDEEGLLKEPIGAFKMFDYQPISGNAIIFASDENGELQSHYLIIDKFKELIEFVEIIELPEPIIKIISWEDF